jgi:hypothetical protein
MRLHDPSGRLASPHSRGRCASGWTSSQGARTPAAGAHREHHLARRSIIALTDEDVDRRRELERTVRSTQLHRVLDPQRSS